MGKPGKANKENLIPLNKRTPEEQREICSKGGKASGESKRLAKTLKLAAKSLGEEVIVNTNGDKATRNYVIIMQLYNRAMQGDLKAASFIAKLLGEFAETDQAANMVNQTIVLSID